MREEGQRNLVQRRSHRPCKAWVCTSALGHKSPTKWWGGWQRPPHSDKSMQANWGVAAPELLWFWRRENSTGSEKMETKSRGNQTTGNFFTSPKHTMNFDTNPHDQQVSTSQLLQIRLYFVLSNLLLTKAKFISKFSPLSESAFNKTNKDSWRIQLIWSETWQDTLSDMIEINHHLSPVPVAYISLRWKPNSSQCHTDSDTGGLPF